MGVFRRVECIKAGCYARFYVYGYLGEDCV